MVAAKYRRLVAAKYKGLVAAKCRGLVAAKYCTGCWWQLNTGGWWQPAKYRGLVGEKQHGTGNWSKWLVEIWRNRK